MQLTKTFLALICFSSLAFAATDFMITTSTSAIGAGTPSRAITLTVIGGTVGGTGASCALTDGGANGVFYPASPVTFPSGSGFSATTQFVYIPANGASGTIVLQAACTGGITATHTISLPIGAASKFVYDRFAGAAGTALTSHVPDLGGTWIKPEGTASRQLNGRGGAYQSGAGPANSIYIIPSTPVSQEHDITDTCSNIQFAKSGCSVATFVANSSSLSCYRWAIGAAGAYYLTKHVSGSVTTLITAAGSVSAGSTHTLRLAIRLINGSQYLFPLSDGAIISGVINDTSLTSGYPGFDDDIPAGQIPASTDTVYLNYTGYNVDWAATANPVTVTFPDASIYQSPYTWYNSGGTAVCPTGGCYMKTIVTTGPNCGTSCYIAVNVNTRVNAGNVAKDMPTIKSHLDTSTQAGKWVVTQFPPNSASSTVLTLYSGLPSSTTYTLYMHMIGGNPGPGNGWTGTSFHTWINSLTLSAGSSTSAVTPLTNLCFVAGSSHEQGYAGGSPSGDFYTYVDPPQSWVPGVTQAQALNCEYGQIGMGDQGWVHVGLGGYNAWPANWDRYDSTHAKTFSSPGYPTYVIVHFAENDASFADAAVTAAVTSWIPSARKAFGPSAKIFLVGALHGIKTAAIKAGIAAAADPFTYWIEPGDQFSNAVFSACGSSWLSPDCLHPFWSYENAIYGNMITWGVSKVVNAGTGAVPR